MPHQALEEIHPSPVPSLEAVQGLPHRAYDKAQLVLFAGRRGKGKTTALRAYVEEREPRVFILDPFDDFASVRRRMTLDSALEDMARPGPVRRRFVPPINDESREFAEELYERAIEGLRDCLLVLDEMSLWSGIHESPRLRTLVLQGRRLGIRMAVACQRISLVPGILLSEMTELVLFQMTRPRDLDVLEQWTNGYAVDLAPKLSVGECLVYKY